MTKEIKKLINVAENLGWVVNSDKNDFTFSKFSPVGQDFNIEITAENAEKLIDEIKERCNSFDCSEETYLWLDNTGHGVNGAPYDMKDLYEDMEACLEMMEELIDELEQIEIEEEYQCMVCGKFITNDEGITTLNGLWVCDNDSCRTLDDDNNATEIGKWRF